MTVSCKRQSEATYAFYYWKSRYELNKEQTALLKEAGNRIYIRFFDIKWDVKKNEPYPEAIISFKKQSSLKNITPVIFITNQIFEKLGKDETESLALKAFKLIRRIASEQNITFQSLQIDCDWTSGTKDKFFSFLKSLKAISKKQLEATIRLHQVKYQFRTGIPPVDRGVLMFYNMGKLSATLNEANSIYNAADAEKYIGSLPKYVLPLDIALPLFSWSIQIRDGKIIQVYRKIGKTALTDPTYFRPTANNNVYRAVHNFFKGGIYIKQNDLFKLEEIDKHLLTAAAIQLAQHLNKEKKRTILYYELGNIDTSVFKTTDLKEISAHF